MRALVLRTADVASDSGTRLGRVAAWTLCAALVAALATAGCMRPKPKKPQLYCVTGRVIDVETGQGVPSARILLRAAVATNLGTKVLTAYAVAGTNGRYSAELSEPFDTVRYAVQIRVDASQKGYITGGADVLPPTRKQSAYPVADILLARSGAPLPPPSDPLGVLRDAPTRPPLPWQR